MLNYHHGIDTKEFQRVIIAVQKKWIGFHLQPKGKCRITWEVVPQKQKRLTHQEAGRALASKDASRPVAAGSEGCQHAGRGSHINDQTA